jgi:hypothetical protein
MEMAKEISSEEMEKTAVSNRETDRMEDSRDAKTRMVEGIREEMTRMTKIGIKKIGFQLKSVMRIKN